MNAAQGPQPAIEVGLEPRLAPLDRAEATAAQAELLDVLGPAGDLHLFRTLAHHPKLMRSWLGFGGRLLQRSSFSDRERELMILRTAARCGSDYEWGQHVGIGRLAGLTDDDIRSCAPDADPAGWPPDDAVLLRAVDELVDDHCIAADTWGLLEARYGVEQLIELPLLVGHYAMLAGLLRSAGVQTETPLPKVGEL
jgi:alkylhydroperoxidase family enzyme